MKKEYNINLKLFIETKDSEYDDVLNYANELIDMILDSEDFMYNDIEVVDVEIDEVEDLNDYGDVYDDLDEDDVF